MVVFCVTFVGHISPWQVIQSIHSICSKPSHIYSLRLCYVPRCVGDTMDMLKVTSMEDIHSLPTCYWGITQPAGKIN